MISTVGTARWSKTGVLARILFIGDVVGPLGLATVEALLPGLRADREVDFVIANGENSVDNGAGISPATTRRLLAAGVDIITTGNHAHDGPGAPELFSTEARVVRPDNLAGPPVGSASAVLERYGIKLGVANVIGSREGVIPHAVRADANAALKPLLKTADVIVLDIHTAWPAEKLALATTLDGQVCAVVGTHTHIPTADAQVLTGGTAYISDVGMTGARDSLIGFRSQDMIRQMEQAAPAHPAPVIDGDGVLMAVLITAACDGRALSIEPLIEHAPLPSNTADGVRSPDRK